MDVSDDELPALEPFHDDDDEMPALEPVDGTSSGQPPLEPEGEDDIPGLMSVSDSSDEEDQLLYFGPLDDSDNNSDWEDEDDAAFTDEELPPLEPFFVEHSAPTTVQGDDDMPPLIPVTPSSNPNLHTLPPLDPSWLPRRNHPRPTAVSDVFDMRHILEALHLGRTAPGHEEFFAQFLNDLTGPSESRQMEPDLERAKVLVGGLETVPEGLMTRMASVGGAPGGHEDLSGQDESMDGCAVCWAPLLEYKTADPGPSDEQPLPFASESGEETTIVSLPCAHVFHSSCLLPWFSRKTTCPTCRFDIDPDSLTWKPSRRSRANGSARHSTSVHTHQTPIDDWDDQTDVDDDDPGDDPHIGNVVPAETISDIGFYLTGGDYDGLLSHNSGFFARGAPALSRPRRRRWSVPNAPGKSLRERIMEKECEMGLRCVDVTCVLAPTDEEPRAPHTARQVAIRVDEKGKCKHMVHPACLVISARTTGRAREGDGSVKVEVACPSCRAVGTVSREDWEDGVQALALAD